MPELPEVETERRRLEASASGRTVERVHAPHPDVLENLTPQALGRRLSGRRIESARRHGKYLFARLDSGGCLAVHFGMTGTLGFPGLEEPDPDYAAVVIRFRDGGRMAYVSQRRIGRIRWADDMAAFIETHGLGPDALGIDVDAFTELMSRGRGAAKSWLMNQGHLAGIGNEYSDEILFQAGIHPRRDVGGIDAQEARRLHRVMRRVLRTAVDAGAEPGKFPGSWLMPRRHEGGRCPRCGGALERVSAGGRSGWLCPQCQPRR